MKFSSKFLSVILLSLLVTSTANANFSDVNDKTDYKESILWMQQNQVINGYVDGTFQPDKCVSRAEFLKMLFKTLGIDSSKSIGELFPDTASTEWYAPYIRTAREHKTINGYEDGKFRPDNCVNRAEAIKMATAEFTNNNIPTMKWKFQGMEGMPADAQDSQDWSYKYLEYALKTNIVGQKHDVLNADQGPYYYKILPNESMSRKEVAEMLYRIKAIKDNNVNYYYDTDKIDFYKQEGEPHTFYKPNDLIKKPTSDVTETLDQKNLVYKDSYGITLTIPETWLPLDTFFYGPDEKEKAIDVIGIEHEDEKTSNSQKLKIAVIPNDQYNSKNKSEIYKGFLGKNNKYTFLYMLDLKYICGLNEKDCSYQPMIDETTNVVKSFVPTDL